MSGFDAIIGQRLPIRLLKQFLRGEALPHAMLFTGPAGVGKRTAARLFASALSCRSAERDTDGRPCGVCTACRRIAAGIFPDVITIEPLKNTLKIDQIRSLLATVAMKPFEAGRRVVIICHSQCLTVEAANALLKILEEPPDNTVVILTALQRADLLPTITSRCRHIQFQPLSADDLTHLLMMRTGLEAHRAAAIAQMADGSFEKALRLADHHWVQSRDWVVEAAGLRRPAPAGRHSVTTALGFAAQLAQSKDNISELLDILKTWVRDLALLPYAADRLIHHDCRSLLEEARQEWSDSRVWMAWEAIEKAQKEIAGNANLRIALDVMALRMAGWAAA